MSVCERRGPHAKLAATALLGAALVCLSGCAVVTVGSAVVSSAVSVAGSVVSTGVKVTGKVVEKTIDAVTPDSK